MKAYKPKPSDIDWVRGVCDLLKDGGAWVCPISASVFRIDKQARTLTLEVGDINHPTNQRTVIVAKAAGWEVKEK